MTPQTHNRIGLGLVGVVALHVADDSFIEPQPGTSAGDHLVSGLLPLAALALAAFAYLRVGRAGGRALVAILAGYFGIVGGIEAFHYGSSGELGGDDFTGVLSAVAGVTLIGLAARTLWTSRRTDDHRAWRYGRRTLTTVGAFIAFTFALMPIGVAYVITHAARPPVEKIDLGASNVEDVKFKTTDGLELHGSYVPSKNGAAVMVISVATARRTKRGCSRGTAMAC